MKKEYIVPNIVAMKLCSTLLLQNASLEITEEYDDDSDKSNSYQGGLLWEEDAQ